MFGLAGIKLYLLAGAAVGCLLLGFAGGLKFDQGAVEKIKRQDAEAAAATKDAALAHQRQVDVITAAASQDAAVRQAKAEALASLHLRELPRHVTAQADRQYLVPLGAVRVYDASVQGVSADALPLPAGKSDDAPSGVALSRFMGVAAANNDSCRRDGQTLTDLQSWIRAQQAAAP